MRYLASVCVLALGLAGCEGVSQEDIGTVTGAAVGGVVGSQIGDGSGQLIATGVGAGLGAVVGREIGRHLDERDQEQLAQSTIATAQTGETVNWENPDSGVVGQTRVIDTDQRQERSSVKVQKDRVEEVPPLQFIGETYEAVEGAEVYGGPSPAYDQVAVLEQGETVHVNGQVQGGPWYMIQDNGAAQGFVHANVLTPTGTTRIAEGDQNEPARADVADVQVDATQECRTVEQTVVLADGSERMEEVTACRGPDGYEVQA